MTIFQKKEEICGVGTLMNGQPLHENWTLQRVFDTFVGNKVTVIYRSGVTQDGRSYGVTHRDRVRHVRKMWISTSGEIEVWLLK